MEVTYHYIYYKELWAGMWWLCVLISHSIVSYLMLWYVSIIFKDKWCTLWLGVSCSCSWVHKFEENSFLQICYEEHSSNLQYYVHIWYHSYNSLYLLLLITNSVHTDFHDSELPSYIHFSDTVVLTVYWLMVYIMARGLVLLSFSLKYYTMSRTKCFTPV